MRSDVTFDWKDWKPIFFMSWIGGAIIALSFYLIGVQGVSLSTYDFAVDAAGNLYVGKEGVIEVYSSGKLQRTFDVTDYAYFFTIDADDTILLGTSSTCYKMDLYGHVLEERDDEGETYYNLQFADRSFTAQNGDVYRRRWIPFVFQIVCNKSEVVYTSPFLEVFVKLLFAAFVVGMLIVLPRTVFKMLKKEGERRAKLRAEGKKAPWYL